MAPVCRGRVGDILDPVTKTLMRCLAVMAVAVALPLTYAAAASAGEPEGWSDPDPVDPLHALLVLGGIPLLLTALLALAVYLPSVVRGESLAPAGARSEDQWFGGRRDADKALTAGAVGSPTVGELGSAEETGGASGGW
jgi:hypothetical protein